MESFIQLTPENIQEEHICCAISDKKCTEGYKAKKEWLRQSFENGYVFRRLDERAKVFIEYGPAEKGWAPITAPGYLLVNCFWVSGKYKGKGHGKQLLEFAVDDVLAQNKNGLVAIAGAKKFHFMHDAKWLQKQGFEICDKTQDGFVLLVKKINTDADNPVFKTAARDNSGVPSKGIAVYWSNRCPFTQYHVETSLKETAEKRNIPYQAIKLETFEQAQNAPSPATIFSMFYNGRFVTTDVSICMDSRFDKLMEKHHKKKS